MSSRGIFFLFSALVFRHAFAQAGAAYSNPVCWDQTGARWDPELAIDLRGAKGDAGHQNKLDECGMNRVWIGAYTGPQTLKPGLDLSKVVLDHLTTKGAGSYDCEHLLGLDLVKQVMEQRGGACDVAQSQVHGADGKTNVVQVRAGLIRIRDNAVNTADNLWFVEKSVANLQSHTLPRHLRGGIAAMDFFKIAQLRDLLEIRSAGDRRPKTTGNVGGERSGVAVAAILDSTIQKAFPGAVTTAAADWAAYAAAVSTAYQLKRDAAQCVVNTPTSSHPSARKRFGRRAISTLKDLLPIGGVSSSLTRRTPKASAPLSGPNAPQGRMCHPSNERPKTVISRSAAVTKAAPSTKPRRPVNFVPQRRSLTSTKTIVKRTADRARRVVGQQQRRTRASPKQLPKIVPLPPHRSPGTPRQRRSN